MVYLSFANHEDSCSAEAAPEPDRRTLPLRTDDNPVKMAANLARLEEAAWQRSSAAMAKSQLASTSVASWSARLGLHIACVKLPVFLQRKPAF